MERTYKITILLTSRKRASELGPLLRKAAEKIEGVEVASMQVRSAQQEDIDALEELQKRQGVPG